MNTAKRKMTRKDALARRIEIAQMLTEARDQLQAWHALCTAMGAIIRLNTISNPTTAAFFRPIVQKAINQERAWEVASSNLNAEVSSISAQLRAGDKVLSVKQLFGEQAEGDIHV